MGRGRTSPGGGPVPPSWGTSPPVTAFHQGRQLFRARVASDLNHPRAVLLSWVPVKTQAFSRWFRGHRGFIESRAEGELRHQGTEDAQLRM